MLPKIITLSILMVFGFALYVNKCNPYGSPILVTYRGKVTDVVNCDNAPTKIFQETCNSYFCQKALFDRDLIKPHKDVYIYKVLDHKDETLDINMHYLETKTDNTYKYYMCEVLDNEVVMMEEIDKISTTQMDASE